MNLYDTLVIGSGPIGLFTISQLSLFKLRSCHIDASDVIGGQCTLLYPEKSIYDIPGLSKTTGIHLVHKLLLQTKYFYPLIFTKQCCLDIKKLDKYWLVITSSKVLISKTIIIATGAGVLKTKKLAIDGMNKYENISVFYHISNKYIFKKKDIVVAGGGDSALDWGLILAKNIAQKIYIVHRKKQFRALPKTINNLYFNKKIRLFTPYSIKHIKGNKKGMLTNVIIQNHDNNFVTSLKCDYLLAFFGISNNFEYNKTWNIKMGYNKILVNSFNMQTSLKGVFAIGDICHYFNKLKMIMTGFSESAIAIRMIYKLTNYNYHIHFKHSTIKNTL